jgi:hypothetical protein
MIATFSTCSYGRPPLWLQTKILKEIKNTVEEVCVVGKLAAGKEIDK